MESAHDAVGRPRPRPRVRPPSPLTCLHARGRHGYFNMAPEERNARPIHCESLFLVAKWVGRRGEWMGGMRCERRHAAAPEVARSAFCRRASERADGWRGRKTAN